MKRLIVFAAFAASSVYAVAVSAYAIAITGYAIYARNDEANAWAAAAAKKAKVALHI